MLFVIAIGLLIFGLITMIFSSPFMHLLYCFLTTILYGVYLIYDT
jgi:FtsH-binding integral membrane protein